MKINEFLIIRKPTIETVSGPHEKLLRNLPNVHQLVLGASSLSNSVCTDHSLANPDAEMGIYFITYCPVGSGPGAEYFVVDDRAFIRMCWDDIRSKKGLPWSAVQESRTSLLPQCSIDSPINTMRYHRNGKLVYYVTETHLSDQIKQAIAARM